MSEYLIRMGCHALSSLKDGLSVGIVGRYNVMSLVVAVAKGRIQLDKLCTGSVVQRGKRLLTWVEGQSPFYGAAPTSVKGLGVGTLGREKGIKILQWPGR